MNIYFKLLLATCLLTFPSHAQNEQPKPLCANDVYVSKIIDGDTIKIKLPENEVSVRLVGIDCFESQKNNRAYKQAYENRISIDEVVKRGCNSTMELSRIISGGKKPNYVELHIVGLDAYDRILGIIYKDSVNINEQMINKGFCPKYVYKK